MTKAQKNLIQIANEGQSDDKIFIGEAFTRAFAGKVKKVAELKNPLDLRSILHEIDKVLEIINPELKPEIEWLRKLKPALMLLHNEIIHTNRILGVTDDNSYDTGVFERIIKERFFVELWGKCIKPDTPIQTDFRTMVEMVELGVRRFS